MARDGDRVERTQAELGDQTLGIRGDVASVPDIERLMQSAAEAFGGIDVVMANAASAASACRPSPSRNPMRSQRCTCEAGSSPYRRHSRIWIEAGR